MFISTMKYYLAIKKNVVLIYITNMGHPGKHYGKWKKKTATEAHIS